MRVERLRQVYDIEVVYRHFPLHPDTPQSGLSLDELFAGRNVDIPAAQARMKTLMRHEGLPYGERSMTYNSRLAQELAAWADTQPRGSGIHQALFHAYFVSNLNLSTVGNLIGIAERVGLSPEKSKEVLEQRLFRSTVDADWQRSRDLHITSVPTFVLEERGLVGAQSYEQLEELVTGSGVARRTT
ncbi:MAG: DsbA family protein [Planctomycetaceae bacterium]|nr:DsbA family protein [Planctomycetales bacterium]MCB9874221.1 DsbA family protein [Planctomycetaceae bacterium]MCB9940798.1 DsbA family protein [Planctomycetaceae bacterium]